MNTAHLPTEEALALAGRGFFFCLKFKSPLFTT